MTRKRAVLLPDEEVEGGGLYFPSPSTLSRFSSGCTILDCVLGGGWAAERVINIVGDKSTGKTLLAIEAAANYAREFSTRKIIYAECESAFDVSYAESVGLPVDKIDFVESLETVEDFAEDLEARLEWDEGGLYIVDSLDALSDRAEMKRTYDEGTYGATKAKQMSAIFRKLTRSLDNSKITLLIVSQVRDNIGVVFGEKHTRSGGKALDFYASQILWLSQVSVRKTTRKGIERPTGINVRAKCKKNKAGQPFRECEFPLIFNYGVEDVIASLDWLEEVELLDTVGMTKAGAKLFKSRIWKISQTEYDVSRRDTRAAVFSGWEQIEKRFSPTRRKYHG